MKTKILVLFGKTCAGKHTIADWLVQEREDFHKVKIKGPDKIGAHLISPFINSKGDDTKLLYTNTSPKDTFYDQIKSNKNNIIIADLDMVEVYKKFYPDDDRFIYIYVGASQKNRLYRMLNKAKESSDANAYYKICKIICKEEDEYALRKKFPEKYISFVNNSDRDTFYGLLNLIEAEVDKG